jgi:hypothetical protein
MVAQKSYLLSRTIQFRRHGNLPQQFGCHGSVGFNPEPGAANPSSAFSFISAEFCLFSCGNQVFIFSIFFTTVEDSTPRWLMCDTTPPRRKRR